MAFNWTDLTNAANTHIWEHLNNLAAAVRAALQSTATATLTWAFGSSGTPAAVSWATGVVTLAGPSTLWIAGAPTRFTAPDAGVMSVTFTASWVGSTAGDRFLGVRLNGTTLINLGGGQLTSAGDFVPVTGGVTDVVMAAGDYLEAMLAQSSGGSLSPILRFTARFV